MSIRTAENAVAGFQSLPDGAKLVVLLLVYAVVSVALVRALGLEGASVGGFTGLDGVSSTV